MVGMASWVPAIIWLAGLVRQGRKVGLGFGYSMISRVSSAGKGWVSAMVCMVSSSLAS